MLQTFEGTNTTGQYVSYVSDKHPNTEICAQECKDGNWCVFYVSTKKLVTVVHPTTKDNAVKWAKNHALNLLFTDNPYYFLKIMKGW